MFLQRFRKTPTHAASHSDSSHSKKLEVIDLTLDSSSDEEEPDSPPLPPPPPPRPPSSATLPPPVKRACPSLSPTSPPVINKGVLNLHHQASPASCTPSMPAMDTNYIPPVPPLIQDYRPYYHTPNDLSELNFFSFLQGDNHQHYNMVMAAAAAASASEDHELLLNRFLPYSTSSSASQLFLDQSGTPSLTAPTNGMSNTGGGGLVSSSSLRDTHSTHSSSSHSSSHPSSHTHPGVVASRSSAEAAVAAIYGGIPDVISLD